MGDPVFSACGHKPVRTVIYSMCGAALAKIQVFPRPHKVATPPWTSVVGGGLNRTQGSLFWPPFWNPLCCLLEPKKRSSERLLGLPGGISRQVSSILGAKRLPKGSPGGSKMESKIDSGLEVVKSQKLQYLSHENLTFKGPGSPKSGLKRGENWFQIASSKRRASERL